VTPRSCDGTCDTGGAPDRETVACSRGGTGDLERALGALREPAPHLRWRVAGPGDPLEDGELACATLVDDPDALAAAVAASAEGRGSDDLQVLASLWWQAYAYRVAGTALACWLLTGVAPEVRAEAAAVGIARSRPSSVVYLAPARVLGARGNALDGLVADLFPGHLDRAAESLRARHALGRSLIWGNVAAACASAAGSVRAAAGGGWWRDRLGAFLAAAPHDLAAFGRWTFPTADEPAFRRTTCCLWWKTSAAAGALCADCSLTRSPIESSPA
jgi:ferric iron reductase protein FhuF